MFRKNDFLHTLLRTDRHIIEVQNASLMIVVGAVFLLEHGNLYNRFPDTYEFMEWLPAWVWGTVFLIAGFVHLVALRLGHR
jgi:hypothetical protein